MCVWVEHVAGALSLTLAPSWCCDHDGYRLGTPIRLGMEAPQPGHARILVSTALLHVHLLCLLQCPGQPLRPFHVCCFFVTADARACLTLLCCELVLRPSCAITVKQRVGSEPCTEVRSRELCALQIVTKAGAANIPPWYDAGKVWLQEHPAFPFGALPCEHGWRCRGAPCCAHI